MKIFDNKKGNFWEVWKPGCDQGLKILFTVGLIYAIYTACTAAEINKDRTNFINQAQSECLASGGYVCDSYQCYGNIKKIGKFLAGGNCELNVCCENRCGDLPRQSLREYSVGNENLTCAAQTFTLCSEQELCIYDAWAQSADTTYCCSSTCINQVNDGLILSNGKSVIVEIKGDNYLVWFGPEDFISGQVNFVIAEADGDNYSFTLPDNQRYSFRVIAVSETTLDVELLT